MKLQRFIYTKTTVVWLLQEIERGSSDRLFRVRSNKPYAIDNEKVKPSHETCEWPVYCNNVSVRYLCLTCGWKVGKVLQFSYYKEKYEVR